MNVIVNWSKKPEGATHYCEDWHCESTDGIQYYKYENGRWSYWGEGLESGKWDECKSPCKPVNPVPLEKQVSRWTGDGYPPVGIKVMTDLGTVMTECEVIGYYQKCDGGESWVVVALPTASKASRFIADRLVSQVFPIRTPEQIAAEERDKTISQMEFDTDCLDRGAFTRLYDAGWRKEVKS